MNNLTRYYLYGIVPFMVIWLLLTFLGLSFANQIYMGLGFIFPYVFYAPGIEERALTKKFRFSLLAILFKLNNLIIKHTATLQSKVKVPFNRMILPLLFSFLLWALSLQGIFLFSIVGSILTEVFFWLDEKYHLV